MAEPRTAALPAHKPSGAATWASTAIMLIGLAALIAPGGPLLGAGSLTLEVEPGQAMVGQRIVVRGEGFTPKTALVLRWDGAPVGEPIGTNGSGRFRSTLAVPDSDVGGHSITVVTPGQEILLATVEVEVIDGVPGSARSARSRMPSVQAPAPEPPPAPALPSATPRPATPPPTPEPTPPPATPTPPPTPAPTVAPDPATTVEIHQVPAEYGTIQAAIDAAHPGQVVEVASGTYHEAVHSARDGRLGAPITVRAANPASPPRLVGNGIGRPSTTGGTYLLIEVVHDYVVFDGFELTNAWRGARLDGVVGSALRNLVIHGVGRTGIEVAHGSVGAEVSGCRIFDTGRAGEGNAEAIYIGTARSAGSWNGPDLTRNGVVASNSLGPNIAEGIDIKDDASGWLVVGNYVTGAVEENSGAINVRGHHNRLQGNRTESNAGSGFRFGGTDESPAVGNALISNAAHGNGSYGYKFIDGPQVASGNTGSGNGDGLTHFSGASFPI